MRRIAVIGSGIAGLSAAWKLSTGPLARHVTLYEAGDYFGGHTHTVDVSLPDASGRVVTHGVDTGFLVFNHRTYPELVRLFDELGVVTAASDMSFSAQSLADQVEWSGSDLGGVFAQRRNLLRPGFLSMLAQIARFNRLTTRMALAGDDAKMAEPIGEFLDRHGFGRTFRQWYLLPMVACIWSCPTEQMLAFPVGTLIRFCHNHGLLQVVDRPQWYTVAGGARNYVHRLLEHIPDARLNSPVLAVHRHGSGAGVSVVSPGGTEHHDGVVFACHSDQALALLAEQATPAEREVLGAIAYHPNRAVLHTDVALLPQRRRAWAAWNYEHSADSGVEGAGVCLHYLLNRLQPLPFAQPVLVSLNPVRQPRPETVLASFDYAHPVFDLAAVQAQRRLPDLQGQMDSWFCGAWTGYGFHEDGLASGLAVAQAISEQRQAGQHDGRPGERLGERQTEGQASAQPGLSRPISRQVA